MSAVASVPDLLRVGALAPAHLSPVDAVMGEDWAALRLGRGGAAREPYAPISAKRRRAALAGALAPNPQAMVKLIGAGGAKNARGLRAQMSYLGRNGDVPLRASESGFGVELGLGDVEGLAAAWGLPETDRGGSDRTSHFVVSFPRDTDPEAAERAGRAWAAELFDSGAHGERWDYYTAFHTDTAYPHIHVVVSRRGLDEGIWLKISSRGAITFDRLREVQVEVAAREGIALSCSSRLSRGVHERRVPDAEHRRARAEGRAPVAPAHSTASAIATAAEILDYARGYQGAAASLRETDARLADRLTAAATTLLDGRALMEAAPRDIRLTKKETERMVEKVAEVQAEIRRNFAEIARELEAVRDPEARVGFTRQLAELRTEGAEMLREEPGLRSYRSDTAHNDYRGVDATSVRDADAAMIKAEADQRVARLAQRHDLDPAASLARYTAETVSLGLGRDYRGQEFEERAARREARASRRRTSPRPTATSRRSTMPRAKSTASSGSACGIARPTATCRSDPPRRRRARATRRAISPRIAARCRVTRPLATSHRPSGRRDRFGRGIATTTSGAGDDRARTGCAARLDARAYGRGVARAARGRGLRHLAARR